MGFLFNIAIIYGGIILAIAKLDEWDSDHDLFRKIAFELQPFKMIMRANIVALSIFFILQPGCIVYDVFGMVVGTTLLFDYALRGIKNNPLSLINTLVNYKTAVGLLALFCGQLHLTGIHVLC